MKFKKVVTINIFSLMVLTLIAELIFGNWIFGPEYGTLNLPRNVLHYHNVSGLYASSQPVKYSRDEHGLRGTYKDLSKIDILTIGGSTTNQLYVDDDHTWEAYMRRSFAVAGTPVVIVNAAVDGQSSRGHIAIFDRWLPNIPNLKTKFVLAYVGINDIAIEGLTRYDEMQSSDALRRARYWIMNKSALYNLFRTISGVFKAHNANLVHGIPIYDNRTWVKYLPISESPSPDNSLFNRLHSYHQRLKILTQRIRDFGAEVILVTQPTAEFRLKERQVWVVHDKYGELDTEGYEIMNAFNRVTMDVCHQVKAICIDLARSIEFKDGDFYDRIHNTDIGTKKIGRFLFESLKEHF